MKLSLPKKGTNTLGKIKESIVDIGRYVKLRMTVTGNL